MPYSLTGLASIGTFVKSPRMPRKRSAITNGTSRARNSIELAISPPTSSKRQSSTKSVSSTKRKSERPLVKPSLQRAASALLEGVEDTEASPDEGQSQNPDLVERDQAAQERLPVVNSEILPLP